MERSSIVWPHKSDGGILCIVLRRCPRQPPGTSVLNVLSGGHLPGAWVVAAITGYTGTEPLTVTRCIKRRWGRS
jgi:hypothetical protein